MQLKKTLSTVLILLFVLPTMGQEIGLQLYSLRNQFKKDVSGTLDLIQSWGITNLEGGDSYGVPLDDFKMMLAERDLKMIGVQGGYQDLKNDVDKVIANAKAYGASYVMCAWIDHKGDEFDITNVKEAVEIFNAAGKQLSEAGLQLVYHPHGYEFRPYKEGTLFDYMVANAEDFAFEMDVYWVQHGGADPLALLQKYPKKFALMHLKDMAKGLKGNDTGHEDVETNVVLGTGQIDMMALVAEAKKIGIEYMFIEDESSSVVEQVPQSLRFLEGLK